MEEVLSILSGTLVYVHSAKIENRLNLLVLGCLFSFVIKSQNYKFSRDVHLKFSSCEDRKSKIYRVKFQ